MVITTEIKLDIYDHAKRPLTVNAIACDDNSRAIRAKLTNQGAAFDAGANVDVKLVVARPDKTVVQVDGSVFSYEEEEETIYGVAVELNRNAIMISGVSTAQFMLTEGEDVMRTDIFYIDVGPALDYGYVRRN